MNQVVELPPKTGAISTSKSIDPVIPKSVDDAFRLAKMINVSGMAPKDMDSAEKIAAAILQGMEVGMPPMTALQSIAVINGRPTIWGDGLVGLVRGSGECEYVKEWIDGEGDERVAHCETKRKHELEPVTRTFSIANAKAANLWSKSGPWKQYPERMLQMRARAFCLRDAYADILRGMQIREEVEDYQGPDNAKNITPEKSDFADRLEKAKADNVDREFQGFDIDHVNAEMAQAGVSTSPELENRQDAPDVIDVEPDQEPPPDPRLEAFAAGRIARDDSKPLMSAPDQFKDDETLASAWQDGWRDRAKEIDERGEQT